LATADVRVVRKLTIGGVAATGGSMSLTSDCAACRLDCDAVGWMGWYSIRWNAYSPEGEYTAAEC
jgi:hypothetical protein